MEEKRIREIIETGRAFIRTGYEEIEDEEYFTDQELKKVQPPLVKEVMSNNRIDLGRDFEKLEADRDFFSVIDRRCSHRVFTEEKMTLKQLSYLLYSCQGIKEIRGKAYATLRTVPCGGARHEFETYLTVQNVEGLKDGLYHYLPMSHQLEFLKEVDDLKDFISTSLEGQRWAQKANVVFYFSMVFYRAEWRYGIFTHRVALIDTGYISENLYLASTALYLGGCAIGAVNGKYCDEVFGLDGEEESIIFAHPVGTISSEDIEKEKDFYRFVKEEGL